MPKLCYSRRALQWHRWITNHGLTQLRSALWLGSLACLRLLFGWFLCWRWPIDLRPGSCCWLFLQGCRCCRQGGGSIGGLGVRRKDCCFGWWCLARGCVLRSTSLSSSLGCRRWRRARSRWRLAGDMSEWSSSEDGSYQPIGHTWRLCLWPSLYLDGYVCHLSQSLLKSCIPTWYWIPSRLRRQQW